SQPAGPLHACAIQEQTVLERRHAHDTLLANASIGPDERAVDDGAGADDGRPTHLAVRDTRVAFEPDTADHLTGAVHRALHIALNPFVQNHTVRFQEVVLLPAVQPPR